MKIVNIAGGLGNQMFQYAFAQSLKKRSGEDVFIDIHHFKGYKLHNGFEIKRIFQNADLPIANRTQINRVSHYVPYYKLSRAIRKYLPKKTTEYIAPYTYKYLPEVYNLIGDYYFEGYWQSFWFYNDIKDELLNIFRFPKENDYCATIRMDIESRPSVGIHVRRGDYVGDPTLGGWCDVNYYKRALEFFLKERDNFVFFIFSNDTNWCIDNILPLLNGNRAVFVDGNTGLNSFYDMYLMTKCNNLIIANSSFSWWGAFLNTNGGRVIAPKVWNSYWKSEDIEVYDPQWLLV